MVVTRGHRLSGEEGARLSARDTEILERALLEGVRKSVAVDFGLCPSSIAEILRRCFVFMGLSCWPSRIPLLLVMAAHAKHAPEAQRGAQQLLAQNQQFLRQSISVARPDNELSEWLSPAEYAVTRLLIEGKSYQEMAKLRETSKRTVANQLASAFHRLGISGRAELLCLLAKRKLGSEPRSAALKPALALASRHGARVSRALRGKVAASSLSRSAIPRRCRRPAAASVGRSSGGGGGPRRGLERGDRAPPRLHLRRARGLHGLTEHRHQQAARRALARGAAASRPVRPRRESPG